MSITLTTVERIGEVAADPAFVANSGFVYTKDVAGVTQLFYETDAGTVYQLTPVAAPGDTPWTRVGTTVSLDQTADTEVIPFDNASGDDVTSFGSSTRRWLNVITGGNGVTTYDATPTITSRFTSSLISWGPGGGGGVLDSGFRRTGVAQITVENPDSGASAGLYPATDADATADIGSFTKRWRRMIAGTRGFNATLTAADTVARANLGVNGVTSEGAVTFGTGAAAVDVGIERSVATANTIEVTDGSGGVTGGNLQPSVTDTGSLGTTGGATAKVWLSAAVKNNYGVYNAAADANPTAKLSATAVEFGPAGGPTDVAFVRTALGVFSVSNAGAGSGSVNPNADNSGTLGTAAKRWQTINASAASATDGFRAYTAAADANPSARISATATGGFIEMGPGGATAPSARIGWSAAGTLALQNGAAAASLIPFADTQGSIGTTGGAAGRIFASLAATSCASYAAGTDTQPKVEITYVAAGGILRMGAGAAATADTKIARTAAAEITIDDNAGSSVDVIPAVDATTNVGSNLGRANRRWAQVNAFEVNTGDIVFTDPGCPVCGKQFEEGDDLVMRVIKTHDEPTGRRTRTVPAHHGCK